jgi:hypothetical protein
MIYIPFSLPIFDSFVVKRRMDTVLIQLNKNKHRRSTAINMLYEIIDNFKCENLITDLQEDQIDFILKNIKIIIEYMKAGKPDLTEKLVKQFVIEMIVYLDKIV